MEHEQYFIDNKQFINFFINNVLLKNQNHLINSFFPCKALPINYNNDTYLLPDHKNDCVLLDNEPYPTLYLTENYGNSLKEYKNSGDKTAAALYQCIEQYLSYFSTELDLTIMDWGCASGRVLRFLNKYINQLSKIYGCDINANHIHWCQKYLNDKAFFTQCTTLPYLPFADHSFDVIYGLSIFTHISELIDMWIMEFKRLIKKNGLLIITLHDNTTIDLLKSGSNMQYIRDMILREYNGEFPSDYERFCVGDKSSFGNFMFFSNKNIENTFGKIFNIKEKFTILDEQKICADLAMSIGQTQTTYILENSK